ncbi:MAG: UDP-3-O-[3-hydroxymyristoyl] glucosamine N-acyltransferase [Phycisphaerales bacterium]|nr:UDP-3-O-[3-hydroxymyristoyl] glucosamine N-acyltransferase [Phycisphaerales bacterium]
MAAGRKARDRTEVNVLNDPVTTAASERVTLRELAAAIGAEVVGPDGSADRVVRACNTLDAAGDADISFLSNPKYAKQLDTTRAGAIIVSPKMAADARPDLALLTAKDPYYAWSLAVVRLHGRRRHPHAGVHPKAHVDPSATLGEGTVLYPGAYVGPGARVGRDCVLYANAVVYDGCVLGDRVVLQAGACIGADGFGYATHRDDDGVYRHHPIPQFGNVVLEDDVEVGSNTAIARAAVTSTVIGRGTKIDNCVAIGHGVRIGEHGMIIAQVGIAGSTTLGHHVTMAGQVGVTGHLKIGNGVTVGAQSGVMMDVEDGATVIGSPAMPATHARRVYFQFTQLAELADRVKKLERAAAAAAAATDGDGTPGSAMTA